MEFWLTYYLLKDFTVDFCHTKITNFDRYLFKHPAVSVLYRLLLILIIGLLPFGLVFIIDIY